MATLTYVHGDTLTVDYTHNADVPGNSLLNLDTVLLAAITPKTANVQCGYVYPNGTAVFDAEGFDLEGFTDAAKGDKLYYSHSQDHLEATPSSDVVLLGTIISEGAAQTDNFRIVFGG